jgi:hypothetical protein
VTTRRGFLGALAGAIAAAKLAELLPPEPPLALSLDEMSRRYFQPAARAIVDRIESDLLSLYPRVTFDCTQLPSGESRTIVSYDHFPT